MKADYWPTYIVAESVDTVLDVLAEHRANARLIAGGTDLILEIERKVRAPAVVVDVTRVPGLDVIVQSADGTLHLGPLVTHNQVVASHLLVEQAFPLARACWQVGSPQIRNRGTVAGNLVTASPANDTITPLVALDAAVTLASRRGRRVLPIRDFFLGVRKIALADDEMLIDISFRPLGPDEHGTFLKLGLRQAQAIAVVNVAAVMRFAADGRDAVVGSARIALGSVAPTIIRCPDAERFLAGRPLSDAAVERAGDLAAVAARPIDDVRGSADYRRQMGGVFTRRALRALRDRRERDGWPANPVLLQGHRAQGSHTAQSATSNLQPPASPSRRFNADPGGAPITTRVNGRSYTVHNAADKTLLRVLREDIGLTGTKEGCAEGECGACTVLLDGVAVMSCLIPAPRADGAEIVTVEGLARDGGLHPIQQAFVDAGAVQCGYCTPGFLMSGASLLDEMPSPDADQVRQAITGNLCRCTGYYKILEAFERAIRLREVP